MESFTENLAGYNGCWYQSCFIVCFGLTDEIYSGDGPSMYVYSVVCYHV